MSYTKTLLHARARSQTTIASPAPNAGASTFTVADASKLPATLPYAVLLGDGTPNVETVVVAQVSGNTLTLETGTTLAFSHAVGESVQAVVPAEGWERLVGFAEQHTHTGGQDGTALGGVSPLAYGAKADARTLQDGTMTAGSATLQSASANFTSADVGKRCRVDGAGPGGAPLYTTINAVTNATTVTLAVAASTSVTNAWVLYGTDNTQAFQTAVNAAGAQTNGGVVEVPSGDYLFAGTVVVNVSNVWIRGHGRKTRWFLFDPARPLIQLAGAITNIQITDFELQATARERSGTTLGDSHSGLIVTVAAASPPQWLRFARLVFTGPDATHGWQRGIVLNGTNNVNTLGNIHTVIEDCLFERPVGQAAYTQLGAAGWNGTSTTIQLVSGGGTALNTPEFTGHHVTIGGLGGAGTRTHVAVSALDTVTNQLTAVIGDIGSYGSHAAGEYVVAPPSTWPVAIAIMGRSNYCTVRRCRFIDRAPVPSTGVLANAVAIRQGSSWCSVRDNVIMGCTYSPISVVGYTSAEAGGWPVIYQPVIVENQLLCNDAQDDQDNIEAGIELGGGVVAAVVANNIVYRSGRHGIIVQEDGTSAYDTDAPGGKYSLIAGNTIVLPAMNGIYIRGTAHTTVVGNVIDEPGQRDSVTTAGNKGKTRNGIHVIGMPGDALLDPSPPKNIVIVNNSVYSNPNVAALYGIWLDDAQRANSAAPTGCIVRGNGFSDPTTFDASGARFLDEGDNTRRDPRVGRVTFTGTETSKTVTLSPVEIDANYNVQVTISAVAGGPTIGIPYVSSRAPGSFTVNLTNAPGGTASVTVDWAVVRE